MSGGGSSYSLSSFTSSSDNTSCEALTINCQLASPKSEVVSKIAPQYILDIEMINGGISAIYKGELVGGITSSLASKLIECIEENYSYKASVTSIHEGQVKIRIFPVHD